MAQKDPKRNDKMIEVWMDDDKMINTELEFMNKSLN